MKIKLTEVEVYQLITILNSIPSDVLSDDVKERYKALSKRRKIVNHLKEVVKDYLDLALKADKIGAEGRKEYQEFVQQLDESDQMPTLKNDLKQLEEKREEGKEDKKLEEEIAIKKTKIDDLNVERVKTLKEQEKSINEKLEKQYEELQVTPQTYYLPKRNALIAFYLPEKDKEVEIELDEANKHLEFIKGIIENQAIEHFTVEDVVLNLGEKLGV
jgi:hypothetical protein